MTSMTLSPQTPHKTALFSAGSIAGDAVKPVLTWGRSTFGTGKKTLTVNNYPVFRSGTFRDSLGIQTTWEDTHIDQMVFNFDHLANSKVFENVPVKKGHGSFFGDPMDSLIGWHKSLSTTAAQSPVDGATYNYLVAEFEIFDQAAAEHIFEGHWPNRSAEVGHYITNAEAEHWPVYQGFAYVDIPAVEGLNAFSKAVDNSKSSVSIFMEGNTVGQNTDPAPEPTNPLSDPAPENPAGPAAPETPNPEGQPPSGTGDPAPALADPAPAPAEPAPESSDHGRQRGGHVFQIGDKTTSDPVEVQNYINAQNAAAFEALKTARAEFVSGLATANKIPATEIDGLTEFAQGLSPEQFATWSKSYDNAPASALFGNHGADQGDKNAPTPDGSDSDAIKSAEVVVSMHRARGMTEDALKNTDSYRRMHDAKPDEYPL